MPTRTRERETLLADIIIGAVEGGTGYWASVSGYKWSDEEPATTRATLHVLDPDDDDDGPHAVTIETVATGLARILAPGFGINARLRETIAQADRENDAGYIDADGADAIVQAGIFGEVVYG